MINKIFLKIVLSLLVFLNAGQLVWASSEEKNMRLQKEPKNPEISLVASKIKVSPYGPSAKTVLFDSTDKIIFGNELTIMILKNRQPKLLLSGKDLIKHILMN